MCIRDSLGGTWPPFIDETPSPGAVITFKPIIEHLFNDAPSSLQQELAKTHVPTSANVFKTGVQPPLWADEGIEGRRVWLLATLDQTFPPETARMFLGGSEVEWEVVEREMGHCGVVTQPGVVAQVVIGMVERWTEERL